MGKASMMSLLLLSLFVAWLPESGGIAVMSVDIGSEWLKIGIVKPGVPMETALNKESRRKTSFVVSINGDERLFSDPAMAVAVKQPAKAFIYLSHLLGKKFESPAVELYKKRFPFYKLSKDKERGTVRFDTGGGVSYSVEELVAMVLNSTKHIAESFANHKMKDVVLTVPAYFVQTQRKALIQAVNISGLNLLQLINDNTAVALNYGIFRLSTFNATVKHVMFYDMGSSHTTVTIVAYSTSKVKDRGYVETVPQLVVKGVGFDANLGGLEMDLRLRDHLVKGFKEQHKKVKSDITTNYRSMAKLLKEAKRVRQVLSANIEHLARVEGLFEEKDFKMKVTRVELTELCSDLFDRVSVPIKMALDTASMTIGDIESVMLMGGGSRIPLVQEKISQYVGKEELGKSINTDEAAALGAVYKAASLIAGFKVKRFIVKDLNMYPVDIQFERSSTAEETARVINRNLYHRLNPLPQKKIMTFNKKLTDFSFNVSYGDLTFLSEEAKPLVVGDIKFAQVKLSGVAEAHTKNVKGTPKGVKAFFHLDESGILSIEKVEAHFEKTPAVIKEEESTLSKIGSKISDFFGSLKKEDEDDSVKSPEEPIPDKAADDKEKETETPKKEEKSEEKKTEEKEKEPTAKPADVNTNTTTNETEKVKIPENVVVIEALSLSMASLDVPDATADKLELSAKKLKAMTARDFAKHALEEARNSLESFLVDAREHLEQEEVQKYSTAAEREKISKLLTAEHSWFDEDGWDADEVTLKKKLKALKQSSEELTARLREASELPKATGAMLQSLNLSSMFFDTMLAMPESKEIYAEKDRKDLEKVIVDTKSWFMGTWKKQNESNPEKNPVLLTKDIYQRQGKLDREVMYLINKAKYYVPKPKPKNETAGNNTKSKKKPESDIPKKKGDTPKAEEKKTDTPKSEEKKTDTPKSEEKKTDTPKSEEKKTDTPKSEEKKTDTPKSEEKKTDTPKAEEKKGDTPKTEEKKGDTPKTEEKKDNTPKTKEKKDDSAKTENKKDETKQKEKAKDTTKSGKESPSKDIPTVDSTKTKKVHQPEDEL